MNESAIARYCARHGENEITLLHDFPAMRFRHLIVIPAYNESAMFLRPLYSLAEQQGHTLIVLVVNQPVSDRNEEPGRRLWSGATQTGNLCWRNGSLALVEWPRGSALLLVDRFSSGQRIAPKQGVGLARKIGCDIGLELRRRDLLSAHFIHNTDADAQLPHDYLRRTEGLRDVSALLFPFVHVEGGDRQVHEATMIYERSLHYYVNGLKWAGSPYAFHTIGSCMAISLHDYAAACGFPKRAGGEDFYLLNKLAKLRPVVTSSGEAIRLQARRSARVPFGTGPAVEKILALDSYDSFHSYAPENFVALAELLGAFNWLWDYRSDTASWVARLGPPVQSACASLGMEALFAHLEKQARSPADCIAHAHAWFDAFRTLKFVHHLQKHYYPAIALPQAERRAQQLWQVKPGGEFSMAQDCQTPDSPTWNCSGGTI